MFRRRWREGWGALLSFRGWDKNCPTKSNVEEEKIYFVIPLGRSSSLRDVRAETMENVAYSLILWLVLSLLFLTMRGHLPGEGCYPTTSVNTQVSATEARLLASAI